jgi:hypothetical protein
MSKLPLFNVYIYLTEGNSDATHELPFEIDITIGLNNKTTKCDITGTLLSHNVPR